MKALVMTGYKEFSYENIPDPQIGDEDALIKVQACAICGSDVHGMDGSTGRRIPPVVMGHEASGIIENIGKNVPGFKVGDRVTFDSTIYCGTCQYCKHGLINLCDNRRVLGVSCGEYRKDGAFAEYVAVPWRILYRIPDSVSYEQAAMVEPLSVAFHAIRRSAITLNCSAAVIGAGMIGLLVIQLLKASGCGKIIAVDLIKEKLDMAKKFGATSVFMADDPDLIAKIHEYTENGGTDIAFEVVGITPTVNTALSALRKGGALTLVGNLSPSVDFPLQYVVTRQITLFGTCASSGEYADCLDMIAGGKVDVDTFISAIAPLSEGASWFERLYGGEPGLMKVILKP